MQQPLAQNKAVLQRRFSAGQTFPYAVLPRPLPAYLEAFLANLRLLRNVPFQYLVPRPEMLPLESIRFFYLDRTWTDRMVDGVFAVGAAGTRQQSHYQQNHSWISSRLDQVQLAVRGQEQAAQHTRTPPWQNATASIADPPVPQTDVITGFLLRSALVTGWPQMIVRAFAGTDTTGTSSQGAPIVTADGSGQLATIRLELLSPSVMIALFQGTPQLVYLEQPPHGLEFTVEGMPGVAPLTQVSGMRPGVMDFGGYSNSTNVASDRFAMPYRQRFEGTIEQINSPPNLILRQPLRLGDAPLRVFTDKVTMELLQ